MKVERHYITNDLGVSIRQNQAAAPLHYFVLYFNILFYHKCFSCNRELQYCSHTIDLEQLDVAVWVCFFSSLSMQSCRWLQLARSHYPESITLRIANFAWISDFFASTSLAFRSVSLLSTAFPFPTAAWLFTLWLFSDFPLAWSVAENLDLLAFGCSSTFACGRFPLIMIWQSTLVQIKVPHPLW